MATKRNRVWHPLHWSTWLVIVSLSGLFCILQLDGMVIISRSSGMQRAQGQFGWPFAWQTASGVAGYTEPLKIEFETDLCGATANSIVAALAVLCSASLSERFIRRRSRWQFTTAAVFHWVAATSLILAAVSDLDKFSVSMIWKSLSLSPRFDPKPVSISGWMIAPLIAGLWCMAYVCFDFALQIVARTATAIWEMRPRGPGLSNPWRRLELAGYLFSLSMLAVLLVIGHRSNDSIDDYTTESSDNSTVFDDLTTYTSMREALDAAKPRQEECVIQFDAYERVPIDGDRAPSAASRD